MEIPGRNRIKAMPMFWTRSGCNHPFRAAGSGKRNAKRTTPNNPRMNPLFLIQVHHGKPAAVDSARDSGRLATCSPSDAFISMETRFSTTDCTDYTDFLDWG